MIFISLDWGLGKKTVRILESYIYKQIKINDCINSVGLVKQ